jgi:hypothetical protein
MITGVVIAAQLSLNVITAKIGNRYTVPLGFIVSAVGMVLFMRQDIGSSYWSGVFPGLVVMGFGLGIVFPACVNAATLGVYGEHAGVGSATVNASQQVGGSIGTAVLNSLAITTVTAYMTSHFSSFFQGLAQKFGLTQANAADVQAAIKGISGGSSNALQGTTLPKESLPDIIGFAFKSQIAGDNRAYLVTAIIFAVGAVFIGFIFRSHKAELAIQDEMTAKAKAEEEAALTASAAAPASA